MSRLRSGYVALPMALEFYNRHDTVGFDTRVARLEERGGKHDHTLEVEYVSESVEG